MNPFLIKILKIILIFLLMINCDEKKEIKISSIANENIVNKNDTIIDSDLILSKYFMEKISLFRLLSTKGCLMFTITDMMVKYIKVKLLAIIL